MTRALAISAKSLPLGLMVILFFFPLILGLIWLFLPAFGYFPALGLDRLSLDIWRAFFTAPGLLTALGLTVFTGVVATALSFVIALFIVATFYTRGIYKTLQNILAPLLAIPHLGIAIGLAFLLAPSGFFLRLAAWLLNWQQPPQIATVPDHWGLTLILALCLKEIPFLLFIINGALAQINAAAYLKMARSLGYYPMISWFKVILPQIYGRIRLPLFIVFIFSLSVVDMALILAPNAPPPFAVLLLEWFYHPDLSRRAITAAGGVFFLFLVILLGVAFYIIEKLVARLWAWRLWQGVRGSRSPFFTALSYFVFLLISLLAFGSLIMILIWSFANSWRFPNLLPSGLGLDTWNSYHLSDALLGSISIALIVSFLSLVATVALLESRKNIAQPLNPLWFYIPLLIPQIVFLFGFDLLLLLLNIPAWLGVLWAHWFYVLPYVFLILNESYRNFDSRYEQTAYGLGHSQLSTWLRVKLAILFRPLMYTFAIAFAVSINEYLPTLIAGKGQITTLTTEMVALASGGDRRIIGVTAMTQSLLPFTFFMIALLLPNLQARNRRGLAL